MSKKREPADYWSLSRKEAIAAGGEVTEADIVETYNLRNKRSLEKMEEPERTELAAAIHTGRILAANVQKRFPQAFHNENPELNDAIKNAYAKSFAYFAVMRFHHGYSQAMKDITKDIQNFARHASVKKRRKRKS